MTKRKIKRNARRWSRVTGFKICQDPTGHVADDGTASVADDRIAGVRVHDQPSLFAIARDPRTIFASWNVDWRLIFQKAMPADRQVHLRVIGADGVMETRVPVEPMTGMHYLAISGLHHSYCVEIGYFQPFDAWHSIARSDAIEIPPRGSAPADADLATIPFHLSFQELASVLCPNNDRAVARLLSKLQRRVSSNGEPNEARAVESQILEKLDLSWAEIAAADRDFRKIDAAKLARRERSMSRFAATSPVRGFEASLGS